MPLLYQKMWWHAGAGMPSMRMHRTLLLPWKTNGIIDWQRQEGRGFLAFVFAGYPMQEERRDG